MEDTYTTIVKIARHRLAARESFSAKLVNAMNSENAIMVNSTTGKAW